MEAGRLDPFRVGRLKEIYMILPYIHYSTSIKNYSLHLNAPTVSIKQIGIALFR